MEKLRQGARSMAEQMMRSGGQRGAGHANRDPLGRKQGDRLDDGDSVKVPKKLRFKGRAPSWMSFARDWASPPVRPSSSIISNVSSSRISRAALRQPSAGSIFAVRHEPSRKGLRWTACRLTSSSTISVLSMTGRTGIAI